MSRLRGFARCMPVWIPTIVFLALVLFLASPGAAAGPPGAPALAITPTFTPTSPPAPPPTRPPLTPCDLEIKKWADPSVVWPGDPVVFTIEVTNRGQKGCDQTIVIDDIPEYLEIEDVDTTQGTWKLEGQKVIVDVGFVGQDFTVTIRVHTRVRLDVPAPLTMENVAVVDSISLPGTEGGRPSNPVRIDVRTGVGCDPLVTKRAEPSQVQPGGEVLFTVEVSNRGQVDLSNTQVFDDVPDYLEILDVKTTQGAPRWEGQRVTVNVGLVGPGFTVTIHIYARMREDAPAPLTVENAAVVRSDNCPDSRAIASIVTQSPILLPPSGGIGAWGLLAVCLGTGFVAVSLALSRWGKR